MRLGILLLLFDVYLTWARIEKQSVPEDTGMLPDGNFGRLAQQPIVFQYMFFCTFSLARAMTRIFEKKRGLTKKK